MSFQFVQEQRAIVSEAILRVALPNMFCIDNQICNVIEHVLTTKPAE